jgi:hypothetical protein
MEAKYEIREVRDGLEITATGIPSASASIGIAGAVAAITGYVGYRILSFWLSLPGAVLAGAIGFCLTFRQSRAVLRATNLDFETKGEYPSTIARAEVSAMFYDKAQGDEMSYTPAGLYADRGVCLLPFVNEEQANEIIQAIYRRFPDMPLKSESSEPLTTLKLN